MGTVDEDNANTGRSSRRRGWAIAHAKYAYWTLFSIVFSGGVLWIYSNKIKTHDPPLPEQVRAIERDERESHEGSLNTLQKNLPLHGDGTRSWVFEFVEQGVWRLVVYDRENGRLRKAVEITNRMQSPEVPADFSYNRTRYSRLSPAEQKKARKEWLLLYSPHTMFEPPVALPIADGSQVLLVPVSAITFSPVDEDALRSTLVAIFWSADRGEYVEHYLSPVLDRWTAPSPTPLRLELHPRAGFRSLPTVTEVRIDKTAGLVFGLIGGEVVQVHAFRLPLSPDDLEECPAMWQGPAPTGLRSTLGQLERTLIRGCPHA